MAFLKRSARTFVRPSKFTFDFSREPDWRPRYIFQNVPTPPDCGQAWPDERLANAPAWQPIAQIPAIVAEEEAQGKEGAGWLSQARSRIGKCITFGLPEDKLGLAGEVLKALVDWRFLAFARHGFSEAFDKPISMNVRTKHPLLYNDNTDSMLLDMTRLLWFRSFKRPIATPNLPEAEVGLATLWRLMGLPKSPYDIESNEIRLNILHQRGPTGNLTVFHRLRPGFVRKDGTMHNSFDIDSVVVSAAQERVVANATGNFSIVVRSGDKEPDGFDKFVARQCVNMMRYQEKRRREVEKRHDWIEHMLRVLEKNSWDKKGAVEDFGTAAKA